MKRKILIILLCLFTCSPVFAAQKWSGTCTCFNGTKFLVSCSASNKSCSETCSDRNASVSVDSCTLIDAPSGTSTDAANCGAFVEITKPIAQAIMIIAPIILLVMGTIDMTKAVAASDEKAMKTAVSTLFKRFIICVIILLLPIVVNLIMGWTKFGDLTACW